MVCIDELQTKFYFILLGGEASVGKDTSANILSSELKRFNQNVIIKSFAEPIKEAVGNLFKNGDKEDQRPVWQAYGNCKRQKDGNNIFAKLLFENIKKEYSYSSKSLIVLIPDLRLPEELQYFKDNHNSFSIKIKALESIRKERMGLKKWEKYKEKSSKDKTEEGIPEEEYDFIIDNNFNRIDKLQYNLISLIQEKLINSLEEY